MKFKVCIVSLFFICSLFFGIGIAQNKVVVLPLGEDKVDLDGDGWNDDVDCNDSVAHVHPNAPWYQGTNPLFRGLDMDCNNFIEKKVYGAEDYKSIPKAHCHGHILRDTNATSTLCGETYTANTGNLIEWNEGLGRCATTSYWAITVPGVINECR